MLEEVQVGRGVEEERSHVIDSRLEKHTSEIGNTKLSPVTGHMYRVRDLEYYCAAGTPTLPRTLYPLLWKRC